jgi:radical SAM protein (TIGR01212 family)
MTQKNIYFFRDYLVNLYGKALYRIPVDLPLSCPNRKRNSGKGCIFCADDGARARHLRHHLDLPGQVQAGIEYAQKRYNATPPYIAYFQSYTNTFANVDILRGYYEEVLRQADFKMVIIATRPDCLEDDVMEYLDELNQRYDLWIELGVQSSNDKTLELIQRGHDFDAVRTAARRLYEHKIRCAAHVIIGLPYENTADFIRTAQNLAELPFSGIKIHNLLVLKKTPLAKLYNEYKDTPGIFNIMSEYDYAAALSEFLNHIPSSWPIMRLTADAPPENVIAPKWWMSKGQFLDYLQEFLSAPAASERFAGAVPKVKTADGSYTFYHPGFKQHFHTLAGAASEAQNKFIIPSELPARLADGPVRLLDVGFGLGYNACAAIECALSTDAQLEIDTLELDLKTLQAGLMVSTQDTLNYKIINALIDKGIWEKDKVTIRLLTGDARTNIRKLNNSYDVIFLDGFSPDKNPELWTYDFLCALTVRLARGGILTTYSSAFPVIGALKRCDLHVGSTAAFGRKKGGIAAARDKNIINSPLDDKTLGIVVHSTAGVAYRDISGNSKAMDIISRREKLVERLRKRGVPRWYKS